MNIDALGVSFLKASKHGLSSLAIQKRGQSIIYPLPPSTKYQYGRVFMTKIVKKIVPSALIPFSGYDFLYFFR